MITLEDVMMILGHRTHGQPVTGWTDSSTSGLENECLMQFGTALRPNDHKGSGIKLTWFRSLKRRLPLTDWVSKKMYVKCHIILLFGTILFCDKSGATVHLKFLLLLRQFSNIKKFSWGSACLAHMYRSLCQASRYECKDMDDPLVLFHVWAWIRMPSIRPLPWNNYQLSEDQYRHWTTAYMRGRLDDLLPDGFLWDAYNSD
ncbi:hypothetical protein AHAS_Ahas11G0152400 [Arachis hypogaea]